MEVVKDYIPINKTA